MAHSTSEPTTFEQIKTVIQLPFMVTIVFPAIITYFTTQESVIPLKKLPFWTSLILGLLCFAIGITFFIKSVRLFILIGKGTLAPWNPTKKIVVRGLYRYFRNPMITGVVLILFSESFFFQSGNIMLLGLFFLSMNHFYFIFHEEPGLEKRFGEEYEEYRRNVPRWIPRWKPWRPELENQES